MFFLPVILLFLAAAGADALHYRRRAQGWSPLRRRLFIAWAAATDALPLLVWTAMAFSRDNSTGVMLFAMWVFYAWIICVVPRMAYYLFSLLRLRRTGMAAAGLLVALFLWGATAGRTSCRVRTVEIASPRLPASFDGFRIVQLSDLHLGTLQAPEKELGALIDRIGALRPDLVVFTGDLVNIRSSELDARAQRLLGRLHAPEGICSVTGNHDAGTYIKDTAAQSPAASLAEVIARQRAMGWCVLEDTTRYIRRGGDSIALSGIAFDPALASLRHDPVLPPARLDAVYEGVPRSLFNITLVHLPQLWPQITAAGYGDVTLAGHVHAMQFKLRLFGREYSPARWLYKRWSGRYDEAGRTLFINDGIGCVAYPMRLGAYPEITLITLERCE